MRDIERLLAGGRALTLTGPGGAGKTRLAIEAAAAQLSAHDDGVWLVELAGVSDPALVVQAIADVLDLREQQAVSLLELTIRHVGERHMLLLLDNCEHLVEACASAAQALLTGCPNLRILATSRQSLRIPGEIVFRVPSLPVPDPDAEMDPGELAPIDSVRLFTERAQATVPTFSLTAENAAAVARLCHHLDGLPLAIELAASRVAVLPVTAIVDRLDDRFRLLVGGAAPPCHASRRSRPPWIGATTCSRTRSAACSGRCRPSSVERRSRPLRSYAPGRASAPGTSSACSASSSTNPWSRSTTRPQSPTTGCSRRSVNTVAIG